jgi:hypothetical protein
MRIGHTLTAVLVGLGCFGLAAATQDQPKGGKPLTAEQIENLRQMQQGLEAVDKLGAAVDQKTREDSFMCHKTFGHIKFCKCLVKGLPIGLTFRGYVNVLTATKEELKYDELKGDDKAIVDKAFGVRDECVAKVFNRQ